MAAANFNKLIFLKRFNNYFNRKILGGANYTDYIYDLTKSGENISMSISANADNFAVISGVATAVIDLNVPVNKTLNDLTLTLLNGSGTYSISYKVIDRKLTIVKTDYPYNNIDPDLILKIDFNFANYEFEIREDINFNPNEGVNTEIVVNNLSFESDYLLVLDNDLNIVSRWYVMDEIRTRKFQHMFKLKRDVIYDHLSDLMECPIYVQKGMLEESDPFVVNDEGMSVNQIKKSETLLKDKTGTSWVAIYIAKNTPETSISYQGITTKISAEGVRDPTYDVPYDIICIPYDPTKNTLASSTRVIDTDNTEFICMTGYTLYIINEIIKQLDAQIYDVQLLPFVPDKDWPDLENNGKIDLYSLGAGAEHQIFEYIMSGGSKVGMIYYATNSTVEKYLYANNNYSNPAKITTSLNKKESSNLQLFRFCSPNYQGSFDINIAKNGNSLDNIKGYLTAKPFTPYIKIAPEYSFLYGSTFKDARGLICGGDFSLTRVNSQWVNFELNNKNYQNIFNREIQNMDFNYNIGMRNQIITGATGILSGGLQGAGAGALVGGPAGAIVGGVAGLITSGVGMAVDTVTMAEQYKENKSLAVDKFNYQLGNIKALPYTLTKVGAFDISSKIYPFVEKYECTDKELEAFRNKIKYESMTVMRIDKISNFYHKFNDLCYFKGEMIRNDSIPAENHILMAIYEELLKGVYL